MLVCTYQTTVLADMMSLLPVGSGTQIYVFTSAEIHYRVHKSRH